MTFRDYHGQQLRSERKLPPGPPLDLQTDWWIEARYLFWMTVRTIVLFAVLAVVMSAVKGAL